MTGDKGEVIRARKLSSHLDSHPGFRLAGASRVSADGVPAQHKEGRDAGDGPQEEAHGQGRGERLARVGISAGGPGEQESAGKADAGGDGDAREGKHQTRLPWSGGLEEGAHRHRVQRDHAQEERDRFAEIEEHPPAFPLNGGGHRPTGRIRDGILLAARGPVSRTRLQAQRGCL